MKKLLDNEDNINTTDGQGMTALMYAAFSGHTEIAQVIS